MAKDDKIVPKLKGQFTKLVRRKKFSKVLFEKINSLVYRKRNIDLVLLRRLTRRRSITKKFLKKLRYVLSKLRKFFEPTSLPPPPLPPPPPPPPPENLYAKFAKLLLEAVRQKLATYQSVVSEFERIYESSNVRDELSLNGLIEELILAYSKVLSSSELEQFETITFGIDYFSYDRNYESYSHDHNYFDDLQRCFSEILSFSYGALLFYFTETDGTPRFEMYYLFADDDKFIIDFGRKRTVSKKYVSVIGSLTGKF